MRESILSCLSAAAAAPTPSELPITLAAFASCRLTSRSYTPLAAIMGDKVGANTDNRSGLAGSNEIGQDKEEQ